MEHSFLSFGPMKKYLLLLGLALTTWSCNNAKSPETLMLGSWSNHDITVHMESYQGSDSTVTLDAHKENWAEVLQIMPIITTYTADGNFETEYFNLQGESVGVEKGRWWFRNDSLILNSNNYDNAYAITFKNDTTTLYRAYIDWDQDGERDDLYDGIQYRYIK